MTTVHKVRVFFLLIQVKYSSGVYFNMTTYGIIIIEVCSGFEVAFMFTMKNMIEPLLSR